MTLSGGSQDVLHSNVAGTLGKAGTRVAGGWVVTSALLTAEITDDGRVLVGAISAADLEKVAASGQAP